MDDEAALLRRANAGDAQACNELVALLYSDLRTIARARLAGGGRNTFLNTTVLVNEAYLRLMSAGQVRAEDRHRYLSYASQAMRAVIVDFVRSRNAERRGGALQLVTLSPTLEENIPCAESEILQVHEALEALAQTDPRLAKVVEMRYFAGLNYLEIAAAFGVTERTIRRDWEKARLLLAAALA
jgi:RNA polymerase sigma factor (TIGR02999 family)